MLNNLGREGWEVVSMSPTAQEISGTVDGIVSVAGEVSGGITTLSILLKREINTASKVYPSFVAVADEPMQGNPESLFEPTSFVGIKDLLMAKDMVGTGLYCIKLAVDGSLPEPYNLYLKSHRVIYIGQAAVPLIQRLWKQELNAEGHGTFFRSIGAVLGYLPPKGSLNGKVSSNYKFSQADEALIKSWLSNNVVVNCISWPKDDLDRVEKSLIQRYRPLLNIKDNPDALQILSEARSRCLRYAKGEDVDVVSSGYGHGDDAMAGLRSALEENLRIQRGQLAKRSYDYFCVTDIKLKRNRDIVLPQIISTDYSQCSSNKATLTIFVPIVKEIELKKFKSCPVSSQFTLEHNDHFEDYFFCAGDNIDLVIDVIKRLLIEFYNIPPSSQFEYDTWSDVDDVTPQSA